MNYNYKTFIVFNPKSAGGKTGKNLNNILSQLKFIGDFDYQLTDHSGHAKSLTTNSLKSGYNRIIAIGGDGTFNEVVNGFFENHQLINPDAVLGFISGGTGADFIRTAQIPKNINQAINIIVKDQIKSIDIGKVNLVSESGDNIYRYFLNASNIGLGAEVVKKVNNSSKLMGGFASFLMATAGTVMEYKNKKIKLDYDSQDNDNAIFSNILIANGKYCGGGMKFLPDAKIDDGQFDVLTIGDINKVEFVENIFKVYMGTHLKFSKISLRKSRIIEVTATEKVRIETDGEECGFTPAKFEIVPNILKIIY